MSENKKPRLCEILGVEVEERFRVKGYDGYLSINPDGSFNVLEGSGCGASYCLLRAIENPENIIRRPSLTEPELAICKAVGAKWVSMDNFQKTCLVYLWEHEPNIGLNGKEYVPSGEDECELGSIKYDLFPSVKPGDCICVEGMYGKAGGR